jgi:predicted transposase/invertase (TIGR01784 family)
MQKSVTSALRERLVYYAACLCSGQLFEGDEYADLCPTIGICILSSLMFPQVPAGHLTFTLSNLQHGIQFTEHFQIHTVELPKYTAGASECQIGASLEKWAWLFQRAEELDAEQLRSVLPEVPYQKMIGILEMISKTPNQRHIYDSQQRAARDRAWELKAVELEIQAARREGLATGQRIGREEGREEGMQIGQIRILEQLLNDHPTADELLASLTLSELHERVSLLKDRLNRRGNS